MFVASRIRLFEALAHGPRTAGELGADLDVPARSARIVADATVTVGLVARDDDSGGYRNSPAAQVFLAGATLLANSQPRRPVAPPARRNTGAAEHRSGGPGRGGADFRS